MMKRKLTLNKSTINFQILTKTMLKHTLTSKLMLMKEKEKLKEELCLNYLQRLCQKQRRTSEHYAQVKRVLSSTIKVIYFTRLLRDWWHKEETSSTMVELVNGELATEVSIQMVSVSTVRNLMMNRYGIHIHTEESYRWPTMDQTPMVLSLWFTFLLRPILTTSTQSLAV